jgi:hypothetical protein
LFGRELALAKREGEVAAREEEADLRAADLEVFRAMLVNQESTVKDLTSEAKEYCKTLAESAHSTGTMELACPRPLLAWLFAAPQCLYF